MTSNAQMSKRRKMNSDTEKDRIKLTDLNADCLRKIFIHLDETHLLNLVDANLSDCDHDVLEKAFNSETNESTHPYEATIRDRFLKFGLHIFSNDPAKLAHFKKVLRYFGSLIPKIKLEYDTQYYRYNFEIEKLILEHCTAVVYSVELVNADKYAFENIDKPFKQVREVIFTSGYLSKTLSQFNRWFPKLFLLRFCDTVFDGDFIEVFPNLKVFSASFSRMQWGPWTKDFALTNANFKKLMEINPQLEKLHITSDQIRQWDINKNNITNQQSPNLKFFSNHVLLLRCLKLSISSDFDFSPDTIKFEHLKKLSVFSHSLDRLSQLNIKCEQLDELKLVENSSSNIQIMSDFIGRFKNLNFLFCYACALSTDVHNQHFTTVIKGLHNLKTLHITLIKESDVSNHLFHCIREFDQLTTIKIKYYNVEEYKTSLSSINENDLMKKYKWKGIGQDSNIKKLTDLTFQKY